VTTGAALLPPTLRADIEAAISSSAPAWNTLVNANRASAGAHPLAVKYVPSKYASTYRGTNSGLYIGSSNFTWGRGVYVTGIEEPLSTAIYGRVGVVSWFDPANWRAFDARDPVNIDLYLRWLHFQPDYPDAVLTVHSDHWLHQFRNTFREQFHIDVVMFYPDEKDSQGWYTDATHTWLAVSDWDTLGHLSRDDYSVRFKDVQLTIVAEEEFTPDTPALTRSPQFALSGTSPVAPANVRQAYSSHGIIRVQS
jgi:hypothetical protein